MPRMLWMRIVLTSSMGGNLTAFSYNNKQNPYQIHNNHLSSRVWRCVLKAIIQLLHFSIADNPFLVFGYSETEYDNLIIQMSNNQFRNSCSKTYSDSDYLQNTNN